MARGGDLQLVQNPHVSNVLPVDRMNHLYCMYVPLSFKYMQMQKKQPFDNAPEFNALFCIYIFSQTGRKKKTTTNREGPEFIENLSPSLKKSTCKNWV